MNLFIRYFNNETLAHNVDEAMAFLVSLNDIKIDSTVYDRVSDFYKSGNTYPFRLKVSYSNYVLFLKTDANSTEEFHRLEQDHKAVKTDSKVISSADKKRLEMESLNRVRPGWYEATLVFKRVVINVFTNKCQYIDTPFSVRCKAESAMDCYSRIISHLKARPELDPRCQYPGIRSNSFKFKYIGEKYKQ